MISPTEAINEICDDLVRAPAKRIIGIDPDLTKSGMALVVDGKLIDVKALPFPELVELAKLERLSGSIFVVEDVEYDKTTYHRAGTNARQHTRIAQNVGQVKGVARVLIQCLEYYGCNVVKINPLTGPIKRKAKTEAEYFNKITGWQGRTNSDTRDAALIALHYDSKKALVAAHDKYTRSARSNTASV